MSRLYGTRVCAFFFLLRRVSPGAGVISLACHSERFWAPISVSAYKPLFGLPLMAAAYGKRFRPLQRPMAGYCLLMAGAAFLARGPYLDNSTPSRALPSRVWPGCANRRTRDAADRIRAGLLPPVMVAPFHSDLTMPAFNFTAQTFADSFKRSKRSNGKPFYACHGPDWCAGIIRAAHDDELPNDSRYELIREAALRVAEYDSADDARNGLFDDAKDLCPVYNWELLQWFTESPTRLSYCDQALETLLSGRTSSDMSAYEILNAGYLLAAESVLSVLISGIEDNRAAAFNSDTDSRLILSDAHGIYIPQLFCADLTQVEAEAMAMDWEDVQICQVGPDSELYWEAWESILDSAEYADPQGVKWRLIQNGDLWEIRAEAEIPEEWLA